MVIAATVLVAMGTGIAPASAATGEVLRPNNASGCVNDYKWWNPDVCIDIKGSGLYVNSIRAYNDTEGNAKIAYFSHVQLHGPQGTIANSADGPFGNLQIEWDPNGKVPAGEYCATLWEMNGSGGYRNLESACETVHA